LIEELTSMTDSDSSQRSGSFSIFLMAACAVLSVLVILLAVQNLRLKRELSEQFAGPAKDALQEGETLGSLTLVGEDGESGPLEFGQGEERTLLMIFSVHCPACEQTFPIWEELVAELHETPGLRMLAIQTDLASEEESHPSGTLPPAFPFGIFAVDYEASEAMARIPYIPATIVLDAEGVVEDVWFGVPEDDRIEKIRDALGG
jgi:peroxiredoxin